MKPRKMNRVEGKANRVAMMVEAMAGQGLYVYANNTRGELDLPKPTASGKKRVMPNEQFQGDSYFMQLVRSHDLRFIREIISPEQENAMIEQKLILDQPDRVTNQGQIEHVIPVLKPINEGQPTPPARNKEVLINEDPMEGVEILLN